MILVFPVYGAYFLYTVIRGEYNETIKGWFKRKP